MVGLLGRTKPPASPSLKDQFDYRASGFDPTGLERAAKAARELDASRNASLAFDVIQQQEITKQLEYGAQQAAYQMHARQYEMGRVKGEGDEARETLAAQTEHAKNQAKYADSLERQRYAAHLSAQRDARVAELQRQEESVQRQEDLRRKTLHYEAELRSQTESKRAKAEARAKAQSERENHDLSLRRMRAEMTERRETLLQSISVGFSSIGVGVEMFLGSQEQMANAVALVSSLAFGVYGARSGAAVLGNFMAARLSRPSLVRETSRGSMERPVTFVRKLITPEPSLDALSGVILEEQVDTRLRHVATSTKFTKMNAAPFRHILLYGPPGTGKTMFAKQLAVYSGLDYAIMTGGDIAPLGRNAVTEIHRLFDWAACSRRGLLLFIDEADAFLRNRATESISEDLRNAFNAFLYRTGEPSRDFMLVYASNAAQDFDWAINDRIDEIVEFKVPANAERERMIRHYAKDVLMNHNIESFVSAAVAATDGFSGREIHKLVVAWQAVALTTKETLGLPVLHNVLDSHVGQRALKNTWNTKDM